MTQGRDGVQDHPVVSHEEWLSARTALLAWEKEFTRLRDDLSRQRRELPWEKVDREYVFETPDGDGKGKATLAELFGDKSQLVVYHFMFNPAGDEGCKHCSFWADNFDGIPIHLAHRDVSFVVVSRAPLAKLEAFRRRMGWSFRWVSAFANDFHHEYGVAFRPEEIRSGSVLYNYANVKMDMPDREGISVFRKDDAGNVFHTYSCYARGIDMVNGAYHFLDLVPKGRDEGDQPQFWVRHHDRYGA
jgi:predicted dithiol-disulfide oxidoreductase (DUF899 family)